MKSVRRTHLVLANVSSRFASLELFCLLQNYIAAIKTVIELYLDQILKFYSIRIIIKLLSTVFVFELKLCPPVKIPLIMTVSHATPFLKNFPCLCLISGTSYSSQKCEMSCK